MRLPSLLVAVPLIPLYLKKKTLGHEVRKNLSYLCYSSHLL
jgi:hypothetical protein